MIINITILEDNENDYLSLSDHIVEWASQTGNVVNITWIASFEALNNSLPLEKCDIFFSDIELENNCSYTGIEACKLLRESGYTGIILFLTAYKEFVFDGYDVQAFNYLLKPIDAPSLTRCLDKFVTLFGNDFYYHHKGNDIIRIPYYEIIYIERKGHDVILHTANTVYVERTSLNEIFNRLPGFFLRSHKSYIINVNKIKSLKSNEIVLFNDDKVIVSRNYLPDIRKKLLELIK